MSAAVVPGTPDTTSQPTDTPAAEYVGYDGLTALVAGAVQAPDARYVALELVGAEVAAKAIAAALVMSKRADGSEKVVEKDGVQIRLVERPSRMLTVPLSNGVVSVLLLSVDAVITMPHEQTQTAKKRKKRLSAIYDDRTARRQRERDTGGGLGAARGDEEDRTELHFVTVPSAIEPDGVPGGLADTLAATFRLPFRREWLPELVRRGQLAGLITPFISTGSLFGLSINLVPAAWEGVYRDTVTQLSRQAKRQKRVAEAA